MSKKMIEYAGVCDIVLTAYVDFGDYAKGDVVAVFKKTSAILNYTAISSTATAGGTQLHYGRKVLSDVLVGQVPLTAKLLGLFSTTKVEGATRMVVEDLPCIAGYVYMSREPVQNSRIQVINKDGEAVTSTFLYSSSTNSIEFQEPPTDGIYTIIYQSYDANATTYNINDKNAHVPYLTLHITIDSNINKKGAVVTIMAPRVSIIDSPILGISQNEVSYYNLQLRVIDDDCYIGF